MAFCSNCGHEINEHDKYCSKCGTSRQVGNYSDSVSNSCRLESYDGEIKKCPNCGEILKSFSSNCPSCGYELRNVAATNSIKELSNKIQQIEATKPKRGGSRNASVRQEVDKEIENLIISFPIPNTKEDVMEFMILAYSNIGVSKAWISKVDQAYIKAKSIFGADPEFDQIESLYKKCKNKIRWEKTEFMRLMFGFVIFFAILFLIGYLISLGAPEKNKEEEARLDAIVQEANDALENHDYKLALRIVESLQYDAYDKNRESWWGVKKESMIDDIIQEAHDAGIELVRPTESNDDY